jgi:hypothetical protein
MNLDKINALNDVLVLREKLREKQTLKEMLNYEIKDIQDQINIIVSKYDINMKYLKRAKYNTHN